MNKPLLGLMLFCCCVLDSLSATTVIADNDFAEVLLNVEASAESPPRESHYRTVRIYYRVNRTEIDATYMGNDSTLSVVDRLFDNTILKDGDFVVITATASPEGPLKNNQRLAIERALALKNYITQKYPEIKENQFVLLPEAEDWTGLKEMVEEDEQVPFREQLLDILNSNLNTETQKKRIRKLAKGATYRYLLKHILPYLRGSATSTIYLKEDIPVEPEIIVRVDTVYVDREVLRIDTVCPEKEIFKAPRNFVIAVKTNLLYDAALLPNLAIEYPFGTDYRWSVGVEGNWSWWNTNADSYYFHRIQIAGLELRRWFGNKTGNPLNGWFVGAYGYGGTYDIRLFTDKKSDEGQLSNWTYSAGLTFGYAMPLAERLNLEFSLGVGYLGGKYYKYTIGSCEECIFPWKSTHIRSYVGLTDANISLVWLIGNVTNKNKGKEAQQ
ncbi:hypothetical protein M2138_001314 [Dysgonomonadaceae bacterium PH5-43]|nr:hypothetical protein [Dysgonomonadaceae bacterium PH5-43]